MSALDFFRKLAFAADPLGSEVNRVWNGTAAALLVCWLHRASPDGRRDEEIRLVVTDFGVKVGSSTKRTGFEWREEELKSHGLARSLLRRCEASGMTRRETFPSGGGGLADTVLAVRTGTMRQIFRFPVENGKDLKPLALLREMEDPESLLRTLLAGEFLSPVDPEPKKARPVWRTDPGICQSCDRRLPPAVLWRGVTLEDMGTLCPACARLRELLLVDRQGDGVDGFREVAVRQVQGQPQRKLLESKEFSFVVFLDEDGQVSGFHLSPVVGEGLLIWQRGGEAGAFRACNVGGNWRFDIFLDSTFETAPVWANLELCGGNIRPGVMAALREGLLSYRKPAVAG